MELTLRDARLGVLLLTDVWCAIAEAVLHVASFGQLLVEELKKYVCPCACEVLLFAGLPSGDVAAAG